MGVCATCGDIVLATFCPLDSLLLETRTWCDVGLQPDDGFHSLGVHGLVEVIGAEEIAVVSHCDRRHTLSGSLTRKILQSRRAIKHGVLRMHMQVHEVLVASHVLCLPELKSDPRKLQSTEEGAEDRS